LHAFKSKVVQTILHFLESYESGMAMLKQILKKKSTFTHTTRFRRLLVIRVIISRLWVKHLASLFYFFASVYVLCSWEPVIRN